MLREMSAIQWLRWKIYMSLAPFGEEREDVRAALIAQATWNVQIAKAQGAYDASKAKRGRRPQFRDLQEFILKFGDAPAWEKPKPDGRALFESIKDSLEAQGFQPIKDSLEAQGFQPVKRLDAVGAESQGKITFETTQ